MTIITQQVQEVIEYSQNIDYACHVPKLIEQWYEAKKWLIEHRLGNQLIKDCGPVSFELSEKERTDRLNEFIDAIEYHYDNEALARFLYDNQEDFFENHLSKDYVHPFYGTKVSKNTKVVKAFKYFEDDPELLQTLQEQASMIIQESKVSGNLFISVHPLDFLSSSENTYNWRSCHALDGEYRVGNLSYMLDSSTVICYLARPDEVKKLPNFPESVPWNSKKWRMLLFTDDNHTCMFAGRQYPFFSEDALEKVRQFFLSQWDVKEWTRWTNDSATEFMGRRLRIRHHIFGNCVYPIDDIVFDAKGSTHYNDLLYSSVYVPYTCIYTWEGRKPHFTIGSSCSCVRCGEGRLENRESMMCERCEYENCGCKDYFYCDSCGAKTSNRKGIRLSGVGDLICPHCYETLTRTCGCCGFRYYNVQTIYSRKRERWECLECFDKKEDLNDG